MKIAWSEPAFAFAKNERGDLSPSQCAALRKIVEAEYK